MSPSEELEDTSQEWEESQGRRRQATANNPDGVEDFDWLAEYEGREPEQVEPEDREVPLLLAGYSGPYVPRVYAAAEAHEPAPNCANCGRVGASWAWWAMRAETAKSRPHSQGKATRYCDAECFRDWARTIPFEESDSQFVVGERMGKLTLQGAWGRDPSGKLWCAFSCDCGRRVLRKLTTMRVGKGVTSCGCDSPKGSEYFADHFEGATCDES